MITLPEKISLANLPTRTYKLQKLSENLGKNIYIKRDDETSGEKGYILPEGGFLRLQEHPLHPHRRAVRPFPKGR